MRTLPTALADQLATGVTTLCWCWRITMRSGSILGFTDHDRDLVFEGTTFEAATGLTASEIQESVGLNVDNLEVTGGISSEKLSDEDLSAGLYDDASVEIFRVDWSAPENRVLMRSGTLGEVQRAGHAFSAEVRGLAHYLQQPKGRLFQYQCDADLGDQRCQVNLETSTYSSNGVVMDVQSPQRFVVSGLESYTHRWFERGLLTLLDPEFQGFAAEVKTHAVIAGVVTVELWAVAPSSIATGANFKITAGCDKLVGTCQNKFSNITNFRGFPHMPGNDFVTTFARPENS